MDDAARICARLVREGTVPRATVSEMELPDVRHEVERRLESVGLVLATSVYSEHVGLRLSSEIASHSDFDAASNLRLRSDACALLVIAWSKLVLQKRTATESKALPGQGSILPEDRQAAARAFAPQTHLSAIVREFGDIIGSRTRIKSLVTTLRRLGFLAGRGDTIMPGPLLELGIDGEQMIAFIKREVFSAHLNSSTSDDEVTQELSIETQVLQVLKDLGGSTAMKELAARTQERPERLRKILKELIDQGKVRTDGERFKTRYIAVS